MARAGRYWWQRLPLTAKREYTRQLAGRPQHVLFRCRLCSVQVTAGDRQGHADRSHRGADILVLFTVAR